VIPSPGAETTIHAGDRLVVVGTRENCEDFQSRVDGA